MAYFVYVVECADHSYYTGITTDLARRLEEHNGAAEGARYTRGRRPVTLRYAEPCESRADALRREAEIKRWRRSRKERLWQSGSQ